MLRHAAMNFAGLGLPLVAAIFTIPVLIKSLGNERFGLLTLIWAIVGYFGLFDFGLGRALTQQFSRLLAHNEEGKLGGLVATSLVVMTTLGVLAGIIVWGGANWGVSLLRHVSDRLDAVAALRIMAFAMPFIVLTSGLRGILEARFAFGPLNVIRIPMGLLTFIGPLVVVTWFSNRLAPVALVLSSGRVVGCAAHAWCARRDLFRGAFDRTQLRPLLAAGGWMTVSNVISPLMGYADRFIIGGTLSASMVAYYTTPNEMIMKLWIIPGALTAVLFPRFAQDIIRDKEMARTLFEMAVKAVFLITLPIALAIALFAGEVLTLWIGAPFAAQSASVLRLFAGGILIICMAQLPYTLIQSADRARVTAVIHTCLFPPFLGLLWVLTRRFGLMGAASTWLLRVLVDGGLMFYFAVRTMSGTSTLRLRYLSPLVACVTGLLFAAAALDNVFIRGTAFAAGIALATYVGLPFLRSRNPMSRLVTHPSEAARPLSVPLSPDPLKSPPLAVDT